MDEVAECRFGVGKLDGYPSYDRLCSDCLCGGYSGRLRAGMDIPGSRKIAAEVSEKRLEERRSGLRKDRENDDRV